MKVVAFNGSARKDGNTTLLLKVVLEELKDEGIETELIQLSTKPLQGCTACHKCFENRDYKCAAEADDINLYINRMREAEGILLGSPTYFADVSARMKAFIERCGMVAQANQSMLKRKVGAAVVAVRRAGAIHTFSSLNHFFLVTQMIIPGSSYWNIGTGRDPGEVQSDTEGLETMRNLGQNMAWLIKKINR